jgi:hypothetical protein
MTKDKALRLALEALVLWDGRRRLRVIAAIQEALAQPAPVQEPVAWMRPSEEGYDSAFRDHSTVVVCKGNSWTGWIPLYTTPPAAQRKPLTDEKKTAIAIKAAHFDFLADYVEAITFVIERTEAAHGIKE